MPLPQAICLARLKSLALVARVARDDEEDLNMIWVFDRERGAGREGKDFKDCLPKRSMETLVLIGIGGLIGLVLACVGFGLWKIGYISGYNSARGQKGQSMNLDRKTQTNLAILRAKELHDAKTPPMQIATTIAVEYPDVAFQALRQAQKLAKEMGVEEGL